MVEHGLQLLAHLGQAPILHNRVKLIGHQLSKEIFHFI
jgi:hypothetical protein